LLTDITSRVLSNESSRTQRVLISVERPGAVRIAPRRIPPVVSLPGGPVSSQAGPVASTRRHTSAAVVDSYQFLDLLDVDGCVNGLRRKEALTLRIPTFRQGPRSACISATSRADRVERRVAPPAGQESSVGSSHGPRQTYTDRILQ
jgi:hypothetical protein